MVFGASGSILKVPGPTKIKKSELGTFKKKLSRKKLAEETLPNWFNFLEDILNDNYSSEWFAGDKMSIADLAIWRLLGWLISGKLDHVPTTLLEPFPLLSELYELVNTHPKVSQWMSIKYKK